MDVSTTSVVVSILVVSLATWVWRIFDWVYFRPKKLERCLRQQGLTPSTSYRLLHGDLKENAKMLQEARAKPLDFSHDIAPRVIPLIHRTVKNHRKDSFIWFGPNPRVNIMNPEHLREVFSKVYEFPKPNTHPLARLVASGVATYEGDKWAKHRKIISPAFRLDKLKLMAPAFYQCCKEMITKWEKLVFVQESCELDVWADLQTLASDSISRTAFGSNYEEGKRVFDLIKESSHLVIKMMQSAYIPGGRFLPTKTNMRMKAIEKDIQAMLKNLIDRRAKAMKAGEAPKDDLLSILMESNFAEIQQANNKNKNIGMSTKDVIEECKLFYVAGQETTTSLLVWTMILLSKHPNWQAKAREEVLQVFGHNEPDFDGLNRLKLVTMILYEVLRLYPPVGVLIREALDEMKLGNLSLPAGVQMSLPAILVHRDREFWGNDALEFKPERFSDGISKAAKNPNALFPFGAGPRVCLGQNFSLAESKMALALILRSFSFELSPSYIHSPISIIFLQPQNGAPLILQKL